jgi:hypothetical protein
MSVRRKSVRRKVNAITPEPPTIAVARLIGRKRGAGVAELMQATGFDGRAVFATIVMLRNNGIEVEARRTGKRGLVYRLVDGAAAILFCRDDPC